MLRKVILCGFFTRHSFVYTKVLNLKDAEVVEISKLKSQLAQAEKIRRRTEEKCCGKFCTFIHWVKVTASFKPEINRKPFHFMKSNFYENIYILLLSFSRNKIPK